MGVGGREREERKEAKGNESSSICSSVCFGHLRFVRAMGVPRQVKFSLEVPEPLSFIASRSAESKKKSRF